MGQRQTDSGSAIFERVRVEERVAARSRAAEHAVRLPAADRPVDLHRGVPRHRRGAFEEARQYTLREARPWFRSEVAEANADPYVLARYGEFWVGLESTGRWSSAPRNALDAAWSKGPALDASERGQLAWPSPPPRSPRRATASTCATACSEVTGARSTHAALRLDRYWRNLRTQTLHDPLDYKIRELGDWALNQSPPQPTFYSRTLLPILPTGC